MDSEDRFIDVIKELDDEIGLDHNRYYRFEASFRINEDEGRISSYDVLNVSLCPHLPSNTEKENE